jgi:tricorn protease
LSPKGERALFSARGDIFTAPIEKGPTRNLTHSSGAHDKWPSWSPDGSQIAFISDMTGEEELYVVPQDGSKPPTQMTTGGQAMRYQPDWSADGKRIAFSDKDGRVFVVTVADKKMTEIVKTPRNQIRDYVWSPSGNYLAFSMSVRPSGFASIYIWNAADNKVSRVTDDMFNAGSPVWDPQGNYLYFASQREFAPQISNIEFNYATNRDVYLYAMALRKDVKHPFPAESDEVAVTRPKDESAPAEKKEGEGEKPAEPKPATPPAPKALTIDFDGISSRVARVPVGADNYGGIAAKPGFLIYATGPAFYYGRQGDRPAQLKLYSLKDRKETVLVDDAGGVALSRDGAKVLVRQGPGFAFTIPLHRARRLASRFRRRD